MRPSADVVVLGDALLDVYVRPSERMRPGGDVPAAVRVAPGGQGANVAVRMARRGLPVRLACALGVDAAGRLVRETLEADGVVLEVAPSAATGAVVILGDADGERTMLSQRVPLLPRALGAAAWTVVSGYALLEERELALARGGLVAVVGCALPDGAEGAWWSRVAEIQPGVVVLNADESRALGADPRRLAAEAGAMVVVTGFDDATVVTADPDRGERRMGVERAPSIDTTGAGDAFAAAFIAELGDRPGWDEADIDRALAAGLELAAQVAGVAGAQTTVPLERQGAPA